MKTVIEWHSVKDRLPENKALYIVYLINDYSEKIITVRPWFGDELKFKRYRYLTEKVTHWAFLPKPPRK